MSENFPCFSLETIPTRDIWQPVVGRALLTAIQEKMLTTRSYDDQHWLIDVEHDWQLYRHAEAIFSSENTARQYFFQSVQREQQLGDSLAKQRCTVLLESYPDCQWIVWQIKQLEPSLADALNVAIAHDNEQQLATKLFTTAENFLRAVSLFSTLDIFLPISLNNLAMYDNKALFIGFMPTLANSLSNAQPNAQTLQKAFRPIVAAILAQPLIETDRVLNYLNAYARSGKNHKILVTSLQKLFTQTTDSL